MTEKAKSKALNKQQEPLKPQERAYYLDFLRICAIIAVVIVHCVSFSTALDRQATNPLGWFGAITIDSFVRWCVPVFVMISGALLITDKAYMNPRTFLNKRFLRILPALIAWPLIYAIWQAFIKHTPVDLSSLINGYLQGSFVAGGQLYFLFLIAGLYLLTPFISAYAHVATRKQLWIAAFSIMKATTLWYSVSTVTSHTEPTLNFITQGLPYVGYFILGYLLKDISVKHWFIPAGIFVVGSALIDTVVLQTQHTFLYNFFFSYPTPLVMLISPAAFLLGQVTYARIVSFITYKNISLSKFHKIITMLSEASFGVYLIHLIVLDVFVLLLELNRSSLKDSLVLIPIVTITSWLAALTILRIPYIRALIR